MGVVLHFPAEVLIERDIRYAHRMVARYKSYIEECDPSSSNIKQAMRAHIAPMLLEEQEQKLQDALKRKSMLGVDTALHFNGIIYSETSGRA